MAHSQATPSQSIDDLVRRYADLLCERLRDTDYPAWKVRHNAFLASLGEREDEVRNEYDQRSEWQNDRRVTLWEESQR